MSQPAGVRPVPGPPPVPPAPPAGLAPDASESAPVAAPQTPADLADLADRPVVEHVAVFEAEHDRLRRELSTIDQL